MEQDVETIKRRSVRGIVALTSRTFILQVISFTSTIILTILLDPSVFGVFFVVSAVISFLGYFSDIGLAAALIQQPDEPDRKELVTTFTIQQIVVVGIVGIALLFSSIFATWYGLTNAGLWLFRALVIAFFLSSLKTIPSVILERKLDFNKLVIPQIAENISFYATAILLALRGLGLWSFTAAALVRGLVGLVFLYALAPWKIGVGIHPSSARRLLSFGAPFQANSLLALVKDDLMTIFLGKMLPFTQLGYIGWAKKWSEVPLRLIMDSIVRVTFPAYARLQHEKEVFSKALEKSFFFLSLCIFPISIGLVLMIKPLIGIIPKYGKWEPALISFYLFTFSALLAGLSSPLVNALNAIGKVSWTLKLMILWTTLTWVLIPVNIMVFGFNGVAGTAVIISSTAFLPLLILRQFVPFSFLRFIIKPFIATVCMAIVVIAILWSIDEVIRIPIAITAGVLAYSAILWIIARNDIAPIITKYIHVKR